MSKNVPAFEVIAKNIVRLRNQKGWSQEMLCGRAGVSRTYLQQIESRKHNMSIEFLSKIKKALGCRWQDLFQGLID